MDILRENRKFLSIFQALKTQKKPNIAILESCMHQNGYGWFHSIQKLTKLRQCYQIQNNGRNNSSYVCYVCIINNSSTVSNSDTLNQILMNSVYTCVFIMNDSFMSVYNVYYTYTITQVRSPSIYHENL